MKNNLHAFAAGLILLAAGQAGAQPTSAQGGAGQGGASAATADQSGTPPAATAVDADALLQQAHQKLASHASVSAKIRQQIDILGQRLIGDGRFLQQRRDGRLLIRLELRFQVGGQLNSLLQVNDGRQVWRDLQIGEQRKVSRVELEKVQALLSQAGNPTAVMPGGTIVLGGLRGFLLGLDANFQFHHTGQNQLGTKAVHVLQGTWRPEAVAALLPEQKDAIQSGAEPRLEELPEHVPHEVILVLGKDDLFPYLADFRRVEPQGRAGEGGAPEPRVMMRAQLYDVQVGEPADERQFVYKPGDVDVTDATNQYFQLQQGRAGRLRQ